MGGAGGRGGMEGDGVVLVAEHPMRPEEIDLSAPAEATGLAPPARDLPEPTPAQLRAAARREALARLDAGDGSPRDVMASAAKRHQAAIQRH